MTSDNEPVVGFTHGPWIVPNEYSHGVHGADGRRVADALTLRPTAECAANARLIAASPDLLAACMSFLMVDVYGQMPAETRVALIEAYEAAVAAIAKAKGLS